MTKLKLFLTVLALLDVVMLYYSLYLDRLIKKIKVIHLRVYDTLIDTNPDHE